MHNNPTKPLLMTLKSEVCYRRGESSIIELLGTQSVFLLEGKTDHLPLDCQFFGGGFDPVTFHDKLSDI